jgi:NAD(P)-dependent dehydrogenase (short-subunit alcohol dehydrogenase family)
VATVLEEDMKNDFEPNDALHIQAVDLTHEETASSFIKETVERHGNVHAALMLVGGFAPGDIHKTSLADIKKQITLNFDTAYNVAKPLLAHIQENKTGKMVFIGARPALNASQGKDLVAYGLSKSLLFKLAEYINESCKGTDVTATVIAPSTLDTPLNRKFMPTVDPNIWVKPTALAELMAFIVGENGSILRENVLKAYNNA